MSSFEFLPGGGGTSKRVATVPTVGDLPAPSSVPIGSERVTEDTGTLYINDGTTWNSAGGGGSGVASVNGLTGVVTLEAGNGSIPASDNDCLVWSNSASEVDVLPEWGISADHGLNYNNTLTPDDEGGNTLNNSYVGFTPLQNSPDEYWNIHFGYYDIDPTSTGFSFGTNGNAVTHSGVQFNVQGTGNVGALAFLSNNFTIGNGTDPFDWKGLSYAYGFGSINAGITLKGPMQGYGFQWNMNASAVCDTSGVYATGFYDNCNIDCAWKASWQSFNSGPTIAEITNNNNIVSYNSNPQIDLLSGNAGYFGLALSPAVTSYSGTAQLTGISIAPQTSSVFSAYGINASLDNVTTYPGSAATVTIQDLTFTVNGVGTGGNAVSIEYTGGGTAGAEVVTNTGLAFSCQIEDGVSTATQVKAAFDAYGTYTVNASVTITGTASDPQTIQGPTSLAGGTDAGAKKVAYLDGDVEITGSLTFGGALSIGQLNAFGTYTLISGTGSPASVNGIIAQMSCGDSLTLTNVDVIGVNTAALVTVGDGTSITSAFLGIAALALPAVASIGVGSTVDRMSGGTFALSLDGGAGAGSVITTLDLCRALTIPNGITSVTNLRGYTFDLPFGDPGVTTHGVYISPAGAHNYMAGDLVIGTTDVPTNSSVALEFTTTTKAPRHVNLTTAERNALTALKGMFIYNTDTDTVEYYNGTSWV